MWMNFDSRCILSYMSFFFLFFNLCHFVLAYALQQLMRLAEAEEAYKKGLVRFEIHLKKKKKKKKQKPKRKKEIAQKINVIIQNIKSSLR